MASKHITGCRIATETVYGSVGLAGYPDGTGLGAWATMELADYGQLVPIGDPVVNPRNGGRDNFFRRPPEPILPEATASILRRGQITLDAHVRPRGAGTVYATDDLIPWVKVLLSRLRFLDVPLVSEFVPSVVVDANRITAVHGNTFATGQILRHSDAGVTSHVATMAVDLQVAAVPQRVWFTPGLAAPPALADFFFPRPTLFQPRPDDATDLPSFAMKITGLGWEALCYACTLSAATLTMEAETRAWRWSFTIETDWVEYTDPATLPALPPVELVADGQIVHQLGSPMVLSVPFVNPAAPGYYARDKTPCVNSFSLNLQWLMARKGCGATWIGYAKPEAVDIDATLEIIVPDYDPDYAVDYELRRYRNLALGGASYDGDAGEGASLHIPAAFLTEEPIKPDFSGDDLRTKLVYGLGRWDRDIPDSSANPPPQVHDLTCANTLFRFAIG